MRSRGLLEHLLYSKEEVKDAWLGYLGSLRPEQMEELDGLSVAEQPKWEQKRRKPYPSEHQRGRRERKLE